MLSSSRLPAASPDPTKAQAPVPVRRKEHSRPADPSLISPSPSVSGSGRPRIDVGAVGLTLILLVGWRGPKDGMLVASNESREVRPGPIEAAERDAVSSPSSTPEVSSFDSALASRWGALKGG